ncbi:MAG TPA: hypothetical protein DCX95_02755 [Elusimicrobia bacterium]|nr:hypothetical protein [Elusimicrobiota bacterium]
MKKKVIVILMLAEFIILPQLKAAVGGSLKVETACDSNVYNDSSNLSDLGLNLDFNFNLMAKLKNAYPRFNYSFSSLNFFEENLENRNNHFINGSIRQRLSGFFTAGVAGGLNVLQYPQSKEYNSTLNYGNPFLKLYPFYYTEIEAGYVYKDANYPDYDLDYSGGDFYVDFIQDLPLDFSVKSDFVVGERDYSERYLYEILNGSRTNTSDLRKDDEQSFTVKLKRYFEGLGNTEAGYSVAYLDSNADEFYEGTSASGDERVLQNYWNYKSDMVNFLLKSGDLEKILFEFYGHYLRKNFDGWLARDEDEILISPYENRSDKQTFVSLKMEKEITENLILSGSFSFEDNKSNDTPYNYTSNFFGLGLKLIF